MIDIEVLIKQVSFDTNEQREEILLWLNYIGMQKYSEYIEFCKMQNKHNKLVNFSVLKSVAVYDSKLSDALYTILRIFENHMKATIANLYGDIAITKDNYLDIINSLCQSKHKKITKGKVYFFRMLIDP